MLTQKAGTNIAANEDTISRDSQKVRQNQKMCHLITQLTIVKGYFVSWILPGADCIDKPPNTDYIGTAISL